MTQPSRSASGPNLSVVGTQEVLHERDVSPSNTPRKNDFVDWWNESPESPPYSPAQQHHNRPTPARLRSYRHLEDEWVDEEDREQAHEADVLYDEVDSNHDGFVDAHEWTRVQQEAGPRDAQAPGSQR